MGFFRRKPNLSDPWSSLASAHRVLDSAGAGAAGWPAARADLVFGTDILPCILAHLSKADLVRCLRVNRTFFDIAGRRVYEEAEYGQEDTDLQRHLFTGLDGMDKRHTPRSRLPWKQRKPDKPSTASLTKVALLQHVKQLDYYSHDTSRCRRLVPKHSALLPSLDTLIIHHEPALPPWHWDCRVLASLQPKHVKIMDIPGVRLSETRLPLADLYPTCERVTLHFFECLRIGSHAEPSSGRISANWPASMKRLDLLFRRSSAWNVYPPPPGDPDWAWQPFMMKYEVDEAAEVIADLIVSAEHAKAAVRVIGLGNNFTSWPDRVDPSLAERPHRFETELRREYTEKLRDQGASQQEAQSRVGELELLTLRHYWNQGERRPYPKHSLDDYH